VQVKQISEWFVQLSSEHQSLAHSFFSWKPIYFGWALHGPVKNALCNFDVSLHRRIHGPITWHWITPFPWHCISTRHVTWRSYRLWKQMISCLWRRKVWSSICYKF
jgi:hypothetical protein